MSVSQYINRLVVMTVSHEWCISSFVRCLELSWLRYKTKTVSKTKTVKILF